MKVTFDSNVWEVVVDADKAAADSSPSAIEGIKQGIMDGVVEPLLPETIFTLEAVRKKIRKDYIGDLKINTQSTTISMSDNQIQSEIVYRPQPGAHPGNGPELQRYLEAALELGFRLMRFPRLAMPLNLVLKESMYHPQEMSDEFTSLLGRIEARLAGAGFVMSQLEALGLSGVMVSEPWFKGIRTLPDDQWKKVANAVAEWADGDAITMHIAYGNDYFCTRDEGKSAGASSILAPSNRTWLENEYGVQFVTPEELAEIIKALGTTG